MFACATLHWLCRLHGNKPTFVKKGEIKQVSAEKSVSHWMKNKYLNRWRLFHDSVVPQLHKHNTKCLIWILPFNNLQKYAAEDKEIQERERQTDRGGREEERKWDRGEDLVCRQLLCKEINRYRHTLFLCFHHAPTHCTSMFTFVSASMCVGLCVCFFWRFEAFPAATPS